MKLGRLNKFNPKTSILYLLFFILPALSPLMMIKGGGLMANDLILVICSLALLILYGVRLRIKGVVFFAIFFLTAIPGIQIHGFSWLRFVFHFIVALLFLNYYKDSILLRPIYKKAVMFYSIWIVLTYLFAVFNINLNLDFGEYSIMRNIGAVENIGNYGLAEIRMAGGFREPSWFAIFVCFYLIIEKKLLSFTFITCSLALVLSASTFGLIILAIKLFLSIRHLLKKKIVYLILTVLLAALPFIINFFVDKFDRLINIFDPEKSSLYIRVVDPFVDIIQNISFPPFEYSAEFPNTFLSILSYFGGLFGGVILFLLGFYANNKMLFFVFILAIINEGFYGRVEFILLLIIMLADKPLKSGSFVY